MRSKPIDDMGIDRAEAVAFIERFSIPEPMSGCWLWMGGVAGKGYAKVNIAGGGVWRQVYGHRLSLWAFRGIDAGRGVAMHHCDNMVCVNPHHLSAATTRENLADMARKGRSLRGERNSMAKLTEAAVAEIRARRASGETLRDIGKAFGVNGATVARAVTGECWSHLNSTAPPDKQ